MKYLYSILILCIFISGCSVIEEITFREDKSISYSSKIDASKLMYLVPPKEKQQKDSLISFGIMLADAVDTLKGYPEEDRKIIMDLKPLAVRFHQDDYKKEYYIELKGDFKNDEELNNALKALVDLSKVSDEDGQKKKQETNLDFLAGMKYYWDGKTMKKDIQKIDQATRQDSTYQSMEKLFKKGNYNITYHFPVKVTSVNQKKAKLTNNKKTVTVKFPGSMFISTPEKGDFIIQTGKGKFSKKNTQQEKTYIYE